MKGLFKFFSALVVPFWAFSLENLALAVCQFISSSQKLHIVRMVVGGLQVASRVQKARIRNTKSVDSDCYKELQPRFALRRIPARLLRRPH